MKKLLTVALFSIAIMANANSKKENVENNSTEIKIEVNKSKTEITDEDIPGCSSEGNAWYDEWRSQGYTHREARALRRAWVRECRGYGSGGIWDIF